MNNVKREVEQLLSKLSDDCSVEDIQYNLYVLDKVRRGVEDARVNGTLSQQEVENRLSKWPIVIESSTDCSKTKSRSRL